MNLRRMKALKALAVFVAFSFAQVCVQASLPNAKTPAGPPQRVITARVTTKNNQSITVNGNAVGTGGTILTGATIETPDQVSAVIDLGDAGIVEVQPGSKIQLDFDENGNVHVKVIQGCALTQKKSNVLPGEMELYTDKASEKTDKNRNHVGGCILPNGQLGSLPGGGISGGELAGIILGGTGGAIIIGALTRGGETSGSTP